MDQIPLHRFKPKQRRKTSQLPPLTIDSHVIEKVRSHKVLGLILQNNLEYNETSMQIL